MNQLIAKPGEATVAPEIYERLERLYAGVVYDAMTFDLQVETPFVVSPAIKPAFSDGTQVIVGPAFTCLGKQVSRPEEIDDEVRIRMFRDFYQGCVQVIDTGGDRSVAHFGDISGKLARKFGAKGVVIDGNTRDQRILREDDFPVFCRGTLPTDAYARWQIVDFEVAVHLPGAAAGLVTVNPGDTVFADPDGVLIVPRELTERVCELAEARREKENLVRKRLLETDDIQELYDEVGRW